SMEIGDWNLANEIRAEIFLPHNVDDQIYCTLTSGRRTEGMSEDDGYRFNAIATYDAGYAGLDADIAHRRAAMFIKPNYFLIFDELTGEGQHTYEAFFHFMPYRVLIDPDTRAVRTGRMTPPNLEILPLINMTPRLICGQNDPVQGWLAIGGQDVPAPVAIYKKRATLPFRTGYALVPFTDGTTAGVTSRITCHDDTWNVRITHPEGHTDRIKMDWCDTRGPVLI
ncbi:MAG: heparinase II/III family protein, partial [Candidatus Latescibacteria bacterium]|nr:heparinase II/III family protein [Candidatus Latescibacterota bacterium]